MLITYKVNHTKLIKILIITADLKQTYKHPNDHQVSKATL